MFPAISFDPSHSAFAFNAFIIAGILTAWAIQVREGVRARFPLGSWLTVIAMLNVLMALGVRWGAFSASDWQNLFFGTGAFPPHAQKTILGGLLLGLAGYFFLRQHFRLPNAAIDALLLGFPLAAAVGRLGCLFAGCCFGTRTDLPWGISYGPHARVYEWQTQQGWLHEGALHSLPVHPAPLYFIAGNLLLFGGLLWYRKRLRQPGSIGLLAFGGLMASRFAAEFFRDAVTNRGELGNLFLGLKIAQWACLILAAAALVLFFLNEKRRPAQAPRVFKEIPLKTASGILLALCIGVWVSRHWFSLLEQAFLVLSLLPPLLVVSRNVWRVWRQKNQPVLASAGLLSFSFAALFGSMPIDTLPPRDGDRWLQIGVGGTLGNYSEISRDCDGNITDQVKIHNKSAALDAGMYWRVDRWTLGAGLRFIGGKIRRDESNQGDPGASATYFGYAPHFSADFDWVGVNFGVMGLSADDPGGLYRNSDGAEVGEIQLAYGLRVGQLHRFYWDFNVYGNPEFSLFPQPLFQMGFGVGFDDRSHNSNLRFGMVAIHGEAGGYVGGKIPLGNSGLTLHGAGYFQHGAMGSLGLRYRIPLKH